MSVDAIPRIRIGQPVDARAPMCELIENPFPRPCPDVQKRCKCGGPIQWWENADGTRGAACPLCYRTYLDESQKRYQYDKPTTDERRFPR